MSFKGILTFGLWVVGALLAIRGVTSTGDWTDLAAAALCLITSEVVIAG